MLSQSKRISEWRRKGSVYLTILSLLFCIIQLARGIFVFTKKLTRKGSKLLETLEEAEYMRYLPHEIAFTPDYTMDGLTWRRTNSAHGKGFWGWFRYAIKALCAVLKIIHTADPYEMLECRVP